MWFKKFIKLTTVNRKTYRADYHNIDNHKTKPSYISLTGIIFYVQNVQIVFISHPVTKSVASPKFTDKQKDNE